MPGDNVVTVSPKYQVVIPLQIREALGIRPGQKVQALQYRDRVEFVPFRPVKAMRGFLRGLTPRAETAPEREAEGPGPIELRPGIRPPLRPRRAGEGLRSESSA